MLAGDRKRGKHVTLSGPSGHARSPLILTAVCPIPCHLNQDYSSIPMMVSK